MGVILNGEIVYTKDENNTEYQSGVLSKLNGNFAIDCEKDIIDNIIPLGSYMATCDDCKKVGITSPCKHKSWAYPTWDQKKHNEKIEAIRAALKADTITVEKPDDEIPTLLPDTEEDQRQAVIEKDDDSSMYNALGISFRLRHQATMEMAKKFTSYSNMKEDKRQTNIEEQDSSKKDEAELMKALKKNSPHFRPGDEYYTFKENDDTHDKV